VGRKKAKEGLGPKERELQKWVAAGVKLPGKSQKGVADAIGRSPSVVSKICDGDRPVHLEEIDAIADYFGSGHPPPPNGVHPKPSAGGDGRLTGREFVLPTGGVPIEAIVGLGLWNSAGGQMSTVAARTPVPGRLEPRFLGMKQYACAFRSDPNQYVVCVPFAAMRAAPVHDDEVHVRRTRDNGEYEDTIRTVRTANGRVQLVIADAPDNDRDKIIDYPSSRPSETIEIRGLVVARITSKAV
jgi:hypothetical protein